MTSSIDIEIQSFLGIFTLLTSGFPAVLGQGGGLMLMGVLATVIPPNAIIPFHGIIQAASNGSRAFLALKHIQWNIILPIVLGTIFGALFVSPLINFINWQWMQILIGLFILWSVWGKGISLSIPAPILGLVQGSLGVLLGATGPLGNAYLLKKGLDKHGIIASNAVIMFTSHLIKVFVFFMIGVQLQEYWLLILWLSAAAIIGSFIGNHLRDKLNDKIFFTLFKALLTLLAINMIIKPLVS